MGGGGAKESQCRLSGDRRPHLQCLVMEVGDGGRGGGVNEGGNGSGRDRRERWFPLLAPPSL